MRYNTQTDYKWSNEVMTEGTDIKGNSWKDYIKDWGCLITCVANIMQQKSGVEFTPKDLNEILKRHSGYYWLSGKTDNEKNASFLDWDWISKEFLFSVKQINRPIEETNSYHIARIPTFYGGHYINVIYVDKEGCWCFDVYSGDLNYLKYSEITFFIKIKFKE